MDKKIRAIKNDDPKQTIVSNYLWSYFYKTLTDFIIVFPFSKVNERK